MDIEIDLGCALCVFMWVCRWAHQPGGSRHRIPLVSCAMNFTGTQRRPVAQVRHRVAVYGYNIWKERRFVEVDTEL